VPCQRSRVVTYDFEARQATVLVAQTDGDTKLGNGARVPIESFLFGNREGLQEGKTHVVADISALRNPPGIISGLLAEGVRCVVNVPLRPGGQLIGVLSLGANTPAAFTAEHLDVAQEVADQLAVAIQQADLYNRVQRHAAELELRVAERTRELREKQSEIEADLQMAREIQQAFMRQQYPAFPQGAPPEKSALRFFQRDRPTGAVGGDFYQVLAISDTQAALFLCDVMGHGVRAALVTAIVRGLVEELKPFADDPGRFLTEINRSLLATLRQAGSPMFVSAFHLAVDVTTGRMQYASAGHPVPMRARAAPDAVEKLPFPAGTIGPVLGLFDDSTYRTLELTVAPGELIVLFTDGLFEVEGPNSDEYGEERLLDAVRRRLGMPPQQMFDEIIEEVLEFSVRKAFRDDACLVGMEVARIG
jgi:serine phosphatase RsbU (regulator of sigma subunit)